MAAIAVLQKLSPKNFFTVKVPVTYFHLNSGKTAKTSQIPHKVNWDKNWDGREPKDHNKKVKAVRNIFLVRHGNYYVNGDSKGKKRLTELGKQQVHLTGQRLALLDIKWDLLIKSTLTRAQETADIIAKYLPAGFKVEDSDQIIEGFPAPTEFDKGDEQSKSAKDHERIEAGFRLYFHRALPAQTEDSFTLIIGHANVIRYFVCRVLQFPGGGWKRFTLNHGSITIISIKPSGHVSVRTVGDVGFMDPEWISFK